MSRSALEFTLKRRGERTRTEELREASQVIRNAVRRECLSNPGASGKTILDKLFRDKEVRKDLVSFEPTYVSRLVRMHRAEIDITKAGFEVKFRKLMKGIPTKAKGKKGKTIAGRELRLAVISILNEEPEIKTKHVYDKLLKRVDVRDVLRQYHPEHISRLVVMQRSGVDISKDDYNVRYRENLESRKEEIIENKELVKALFDVALPIIDDDKEMNREELRMALVEAGYECSMARACSVHTRVRRELGILGKPTRGNIGESPSIKLKLSGLCTKLLTEDPDLTYNSIMEKLKGLGYNFPSNLVFDTFGYAKKKSRDARLVAKTEETKVSKDSEDKPVESVAKAPEPKATNFSVSPDQIIDAISSMNNDRKELRRDNTDLTKALQNLSARNAELAGKVSMLEAKVKDYCDKETKRLEKKAELDMAKGRSEDSLTGKDRQY